jgi:hypothetical protein
MSYRDDVGGEPWAPYAQPQAPVLDRVNHPIIAVANILAAELMEILGPFCWAALILSFLYAEFWCT